MTSNEFLIQIRSYISELEPEFIERFVAKYLKKNNLVYSLNGVTEDEIAEAFSNSNFDRDTREAIVFASFNNLVFLESLFDATPSELTDFGYLVLFFENNTLSFRLLIKELKPPRFEHTIVSARLGSHVGVLVNEEKLCLLFIVYLFKRRRIEDGVMVWSHFKSINFLWRSTSLIEEFVFEKFKPLFNESNYVNLNTLKFNTNVFRFHLRELWWKHSDPDIDDFLFVIDAFLCELDSEINRLVFREFSSRSSYHEEWMDVEISKFKSIFHTHFTYMDSLLQNMHGCLSGKLIDSSDECRDLDPELWSELSREVEETKS